MLPAAPASSHLILAYLRFEGRRHGLDRGNQDGAAVASHLPNLLATHARAEQLRRFSGRYTDLQALALSAQERGQRFEVLWRDVLTYYGWMPKKMRISGEENDFTAIYQGQHILGEVRWFSEPMSGGKMREFTAKLDPRPQTIGLFISHSGFDEGARSVLRRAINSKTVVMFGRDAIDLVLVECRDPGPILTERLRDVYDRILEP